MAGEKRSKAEEDALTRLYASKHGDPDHAELEKQYNDARRDRFVANGGDPDQYVDQRDVRHEFKFDEKKDASGFVTEKWGQSAVDPNYDDGRRYSLKSPDEVINWRNTEAGGAADRNACRSVSGGTGDDAGHLITPELGADPGDKGNISRQNFIANQGGGTYHDFENDIKAEAGTRPQQIEVTARYRKGPDQDPEKPREFMRTMSVHDQDEQGKPIKKSEKSLDFANMKTASVRDRDQGGDGSRTVDYERRRETDKALSAADVPEKRAAWRSDKKREMRDQVKGGDSESQKRER